MEMFDSRRTKTVLRLCYDHITSDITKYLDLGGTRGPRGEVCHDSVSVCQGKGHSRVTGVLQMVPTDIAPAGTDTI